MFAGDHLACFQDNVGLVIFCHYPELTWCCVSTQRESRRCMFIAELHCKAPFLHLFFYIWAARISLCFTFEGPRMWLSCVCACLRFLHPHACSDADVPQRQQQIQKLTWKRSHGLTMCCCWRPAELASESRDPLIPCMLCFVTVCVLYVCSDSAFRQG